MLSCQAMATAGLTPATRRTVTMLGGPGDSRFVSLQRGNVASPSDSPRLGAGSI